MNKIKRAGQSAAQGDKRDYKCRDIKLLAAFLLILLFRQSLTAGNKKNP
jgi:hypothetical protein